MEKLTFFNNTWIELSLIGEGSYGKVYKCKKNNSNEISAIKSIIIRNSPQEINLLTNQGFTKEDITKELKDSLKGYISEVKLLQKLKGSTNIVNIEDYELITDSDGYGLILNIRMEFLYSLDDYFEKKNVTNKDIIKLGYDISKALEDCDKVKIIHRDIKPDNIFVNEFGDFKLGDFGIARTLEKTSSSLSQKGTFNYIAPEVYKGKRYNKTVDFYSLGIVLYKYFNYNRIPFLPPYPESIRVRDRQDAIVKRCEGNEITIPLNASEKEFEVIKKMLEFNPKNRYLEATDLRKDLEELLKEDERVLPKVKKKISNRTKNSLISSYDKKNYLKYIVICIISLFIVCTSFMYYNLNYVYVPNVTNNDSDIAVSKLEKLKFNTKTEYKVVKDDKKIGKVIKQSISNKKVKKKSLIKLYVGISDKIVTMPDLSGKTKDEVTIILEKIGLVPNFSFENDDNIEANYVISQLTKVGDKVNKGMSVDVLISLGKELKDNEWSDWIDSLPNDINKSKYDIEERKLYSSRTKETITSDTVLSGWTLAGTTGEDKYDVLNKTVTNSEYNSIKSKYEVVSATMVSVSATCYYCATEQYASEAYLPGAGKSCPAGTSLFSLYFSGYGDTSIKNGSTNVQVNAWDDHTCLFENVGPGYWNVTYKENVGNKKYNYYRYTDWTPYQEEKLSSSNNFEVRTKTQYRYKKK